MDSAIGGTETIYEPLRKPELLNRRRWGSTAPRWQRIALWERALMGWTRMAARDRPERPVAAFMRIKEAIVRVGGR
jgi:hypothetical protein